MVDLEQLRNTGADVKLNASNPDGLNIDGAEFTAGLDTLGFSRDAETFLGNGDRSKGLKVIQDEIRRLGGDPNCGNWMIKASLSLLGLLENK